jgi:hypothetical protein
MKLTQLSFEPMLILPRASGFAPGPCGWATRPRLLGSLGRRRHNVIERSDNVRRDDRKAHRPLVAYRAGACASGCYVCRELVPARAGKRPYTRPRFPDLGLPHSTVGRVVPGATDLARAQTPWALFR